MMSPQADSGRAATADITAGMISFIVPNYNHARYVRAAIDSALAQTYSNTEIIVVDDGSTDNSREVLAEYGERIRTIFQANAGLSGARNTGVAAARGEYIALLDADDTIEPNYAERLLAVLASHSDADGVYCGFRFVDQDDQPLPQVENRIVAPDELYAAMLYDGNFWVPESLLARTACYRELGQFDTRQRFVEDWDVWLRFSKHYRIYGIEDILIRYRVVAGSLWCNPPGNLNGRLMVLGKHLGSQPTHPGSSTAHKAYASAHFRAVIEYVMVEDAESSYNCLVTAASIYPDLLVDSATYYELACGPQARGYRGLVNKLDLAARQDSLFELTERLAAAPALSGRIAPTQTMQGQVLWAMARLQYQSGNAQAARSALLRAGRLDSSLLRNRQFAALLARTVVGARQVARLKRMARVQ
jgi:hypothetical protein